MDKNHSLHYFTEHRNCKHYLSKVNTGFVHRMDSLDELVKLSNMSKRTFFRKFKAAFNTTAYQWMLKQTVNTIIDEFSRPDAVLNEVAERLGFHSISNFSNFCKRNTGHTPTELIQKCRNNEIVKEDIGC